jgi:hypothetical protein
VLRSALSLMQTSSNSKYEILTDELVEEIARLPAEDQSQILVLGNHPDYPGQWVVDCLDSSFFFHFEDRIGPFRSVSPAGLGEFLSLARSLGYRVLFEDDPKSILATYDRLNDPPPFELQSVVSGTQYGFYPWQLQGFNFLKDKQGGKAIWSTGTGKTALAAALVRYHLGSTAQLVFYLAKAHNKVNTQRKLRSLGGVESIVLDASTPVKREQLYIDLYERLEAGENLVLITNYEKFREDEEAFKILMSGRDVMCVWDEMPTRLSNRDTKLYHAVLRCIWKTAKDRPDDVPNPLKSKLRVKSYRGYELTATPIENDIEGDFNCTRLIDPKVFGSVSDFKNEYAATMNFFNPHKVDTWKNLDKFAAKQAHITHVVNKKDPDIAKFFPKVRYEPLVIDWDDRDRKVYDALAGKALDVLEANFDEANVLALIGVMQMMCDAPSMVNLSAQRRADYADELAAFIAGESDKEPKKSGSDVALALAESLGSLSDDRHTKLLTLKELITETHADERILVYTAFGPMLLPILSAHLDDWGVRHVVYSGTQRQRQEALDTYRADDSIQVWLSSDAGSDSIDLEMATVGIDYDLPWKATTRVQRWNRANRAGAKHDQQRFYSLLMANSVEHRKLEIIEKKQGFHDEVYEGKLNEEALSSRMTSGDLMYVLTGDESAIGTE